MGRKTKEQLIQEKRIKLSDDLIQKNKYLRNPIHYKNNYWCWAAWDSWAAQGKAGSCRCGCGYYNGTLKNKRTKTYKNRDGRFEKYPLEVSPDLCSDCIHIIEEKIKTKFKRH